jgi:LuxR family transcriptional regulator, maltose regulon positive regulatory protein
MPRTRTLAKLTRPRLRGAVARERLFELLDQAQQDRSACCVVGPPGAGKTTLVASWLDARSIKGIWYQVDAGDADLATFFYYLGQAAAPFSRRSKRSLPLLTPEYLANVEGFSRRFFRELFARLPADGTLVLDNYQEVPAEHKFHELVALAVEEVPQGITLIAISRRDPPDCYARLIANENVAFVEWEDLKLTLSEARRITNERSQLGEEALIALHARSEGWAAGLTLLIEGLHERPDTSSSKPDAGHEAVFNYFATQIFKAASEDTRHFLMATAHLSQISVSVASELSGESRATVILEDLYRRHLFIHRREAGERTYWYHALFREFLLEQALRLWSGVQGREIRIRLAKLILDKGEHEEAFSLLCQSQCWDEAGEIITQQASSMLAQGRGETLRAWISTVPPERMNTSPWLAFWMGVSLIAVDQDSARTHLERAYDAFVRSHDTMGQVRAVSAIIGTYFFEWMNWHPLDRWIALLEDLFLAQPEYPSAEIELDVYCSMLIATLYRQPSHHLLPVCAERISALVESSLDVNRRLAGITVLLTYCNLANQQAFGRRLVDMAVPLLGDPSVTPLNRVWWYSRLSFFLCVIGDFQEVQACIDSANRIIGAHGLSGLKGGRVTLVAHEHWAMLGMRNWNRAAALARAMTQTARPSHPSEFWQSSQARMRLAICEGDIHAAVQEGPACLSGAINTGMTYLEVMARLYFAEALAEAGRAGEALVHLGRCRDLIRDSCLAYYEPEILLIEAYIARDKASKQRCLDLIAEGFALAAQVNELWRDGRLFQRVLAAMCAEALEAGIEVSYVRALTQRFRLEPPVCAGGTWPWPVRVRTLGSFELYAGENLISFSRKAPKKPLSVLKAIIAFGPQPVPLQRLADALWHGAEGDAATHALSVALLRLRKLLGAQDAIIVREECVSLNPSKCWIDANALESALQESASDAVTRIYQGNFLPGDTDEPWTAPRRERLRAAFIRHASASGQKLEASLRWDEALEHYLNGIATDDLAEGLYQGAMRCYLRLLKPAEGIALYRRLRQVLSVVLGVQPAPFSEALANELRTVARGP